MKVENILKASLLLGLIYGPANADDQSCTKKDLADKCKNLVVKYTTPPSGQINSTMSGNFMACTGQEITGHEFTQGEKNRVCVKGNTDVKVGPQGTATNYVNVNITTITDKENHNSLVLQCHGTAGLSKSNCETSTENLDPRTE